MKMMRKTQWIAVLVGLVSLSEVSLAQRGRGPRGPSPVRADKVEVKVLPANITVVAPLVGRQQVDVFPKVTGRVASFAVKEGEPVKENQLLMRIDRNDPGETFLSVPLVSPIKGWVGRWHVLSIGEAVSSQNSVVTIVDDSALRATVYLPSNEWLKVSRDTSIAVTVGNETRPGKVVTIARAADASSGRGSVVVEIANADHTWRAGLVARVTLGLEPRERLMIPASALFITENGAHVFVVEAGGEQPSAKRVPVTFQLVSTDMVEITSGLNDGDMLVTMGGNLLSPGAPVRIIEDEVAARETD